MAYTKQTWVDGSAGGTPISAARLTHMENGIDDADIRLDAANEALMGVVGQRIRSTWWSVPWGSAATAAFTADGQTTYIPLAIPKTATVDRIACEVTAVGSAGSVVRMGIFKSGATNDVPLDLVLDAGTVDATTTGVKEIIISQPLTPGIYFLLATSQGAPTTHPTLRSIATGISPMAIAQTAAVALGYAIIGFTGPNVTGAYPATLTPTGGSATPMRVSVRFA